MIAIGGTHLKSYGTCMVYMQFPDREANCKFHVVDVGPMDPEVLFGNPTLRHMGAKLMIGDEDYLPQRLSYRPVDRKSVKIEPVEYDLNSPQPVDVSVFRASSINTAVLRAVCETGSPMEPADEQVLFVMNRDDEKSAVVACVSLDEERSDEDCIVRFEPEVDVDDAFQDVDGIDFRPAGSEQLAGMTDEAFLAGLKVDAQLNAVDRVKLEEVLLQYKDAFSPVFVPGSRQNIEGFGLLSGVEHAIDTGENRPFRMRARRFPLSQEKEVESMINDLLAKQAIRPSNSPYCSVIVLVKKADGSLRFCIDFRKLNSITRPDAFPLPRIDGLIDSLTGKAVFSSLDLKSGYYNIRIRDEDVHKTAFVFRDQLFEWLRMPFGLSNAPATFSRAMREVFRQQLGRYVAVYIDDILVYSDTMEEHMEHLRDVLRTVNDAGLKLNPNKCHFAQSEVKYLGHLIGREGIRVDPRKVDAIRNFPKPETKQQMQRFLGILNYLRRFCVNLAKCTDLLFGLLVGLSGPGAPLKWTEEASVAFEEVRVMVSSTPVLQMPVVGQPYFVTTDASMNGIGAVLEQGDETDLRPVAYASKATTKAERKYSTTHLEARAVIFALDAFRSYLTGERIVIFTDHKPLLSLFTKELPNSKLYRWLLILQSYNVELRYKPGALNVVADALSRAPLEAPHVAGPHDDVSSASFVMTESIRVVSLTDPDQRNKLIEFNHSGRFAGHASAEKTWRRMEPFYGRNWPTLRQDIKSHYL